MGNILITLQIFEDTSLGDSEQFDIRFFSREWETWIDVTTQFRLEKKEKFVIGLFISIFEVGWL